MIPTGIVVVADNHDQRAGPRRPAALEHVANRPIVYHVLNALRGADVERLVIVGSAHALGSVQDSLRIHGATPKRVEFRVNEKGGGLAGALRTAAPVVNGGPCIVHLAEGLLDEPLAPLMKGLEDGPLDVLLLVRRADDGSGRRNRVLHVVSSLGSSGSQTSGGPAGIGLFASGSLGAVSEAGLDGDILDLTPVGKRLADAGARVQLHAVDAWRDYAGNPGDLLELNRVALEGLPAHVPSGFRAGNRIEGRVRVDRTATVTSSVIVGPAIIGPDAHVANAYIGPYTSVGPHARIEGAEVERSIISPRASVMHVGGRLESSVIGLGARVFRDFSVPRAMRLRVGEGDEVALC